MRQGQANHSSSSTPIASSPAASAIAQKFTVEIVENSQSLATTPTIHSAEEKDINSPRAIISPQPLEPAAVANPPASEDVEMSPEDQMDEEEARILAELEAECQAEEKARQKRRKLEERLAAAKKKKDPTILPRFDIPAIAAASEHQKERGTEEQSVLGVQQDSTFI